MKTITRLLTFFSLFLLYVIFRELAELVIFARSLHPVLGYVILILLAGFVGYFVVLPISQIIVMPKSYSPTKSKSKAKELTARRLKNLRTNKALREAAFDFDGHQDDEAAYDRAIAALAGKSEAIRKKYVLQLFYSSSISQNGFLDAILVLSSCVNLVKEMFILYHGRVSNKDLFTIARNVYLSMAIGGSEGVEYATQELFSKFATDGVKSVPFADKIFGSLADGFVNAALLTRISLITENYCKLVYIESDSDLYPSSEFIVKTTKLIMSDIFEKMTVELLRMSKEKTVDYIVLAMNPVGHLLGRTVGKVVDSTSKFASFQKEVIKDVAGIANKPFVYGIHRFTSIFKKQRN